MNKKRRSQIKEVYAVIKDMRHQLEELLNEETDGYNNMPENLQGTEKGEESEEAQDNMSDAIECLDEALESLDEVV